METMGGSKDVLAEYLHRDVGLSKKAHADAIAEYVKLTLAVDAARTIGAPRGGQITLCVEGNISAGKSTFLADIIQGSETLQVTCNLALLRVLCAKLREIRIWSSTPSTPNSEP
jgi:hypothetical protein